MKLAIILSLLITIILPSQEKLQAAPAESKSTEKSLSRESADKLITTLAADLKQKLTAERTAEIEAKVIKHGDKSMPFEFIKYGDEPNDGHSLLISMHGGGNAAPQVNDGQWRNQIRLYKPTEGFYIAPRAPTNTWNLWHEAHIDPMFDRLIEDFVIAKGVNPNKIYITGYSAGGDGTYQLAPRLADRFAAAAMMAGHPNEARPDNLYNLPFFIQMGGRDGAYDRNKIAAQWDEKLNVLEKANPGAYPHKTIIYPDFGHWMNGKDKVAIPWMLEKTRVTWPKTIVWHQDDITVKRFYWLYNDTPKKDDHIKASVDGQTITLDSKNVNKITLRLNDNLINLDQEITVKNAAGKELFKGKVSRTQKAIEESLKQRFDPTTAATALLQINLAAEGN